MFFIPLKQARVIHICTRQGCWFPASENHMHALHMFAPVGHDVTDIRCVAGLLTGLRMRVGRVAVAWPGPLGGSERQRELGNSGVYLLHSGRKYDSSASSSSSSSFDHEIMGGCEPELGQAKLLILVGHLFLFFSGPSFRLGELE